MFFDSDSPGALPPDHTTPRGVVVWTRNKFLTGLAVAAPLIITFWILQFVYNTLHDWNESTLKFLASEFNTVAGHVAINTESPGFKDFNTFIGVLIPLVVLIALGTLASNVIGRQVVEAVDRLVLRVPFINFIYKLLKQVIDSVRKFGGKQNFKRVVYISYPSPGMWMLGFVTGQFHDRQRDKAMSMVFIPGALSPMTGLLLAVESERLSDAPMSMEEAMKLVFSGGLVPPDSMGQARPAPAAAPVPTRRDLPPGLPVADADELPLAGKDEVPADAAGKPAPSALGTLRRAVTSWMGM